MIVATVTTCPRRWKHYQRLRRNYAAMAFPFPLRTFQCEDALHNPRINNNLNARAALRYGERILPSDSPSWVLYLEDDIVLHLESARCPPFLVDFGAKDGIDCWFFCHRKNPVRRQFRLGEMIVNELDPPVEGSHALLLPKRHLRSLLTRHWTGLADQEIFAALPVASATILQVVDPVLVEHVGEVSTFNPHQPTKLEINYANPSSLSPAPEPHGHHSLS